MRPSILIAAATLMYTLVLELSKNLLATIKRFRRLLPLSALLPALALADATPRFIDAKPALRERLKIMAVGQAEMRDSLRVPARVELNQRHVTRIGASVTGRIVAVKAMLGQSVRKGETLALLDSTELGIAQAAYLKAASQVNLRRLAANRARRLLDAGVIAPAVMQEREGQLHEAEVDLRASADQLRVMGMDEASINRLAREKTIHSTTPVVASFSGTVIERNVAIGQVVQPADALYTVADLSQVWLVAEVPEQQAQWAREGDEASAAVAALPGETFNGKLIYVADLVNPATRTVTVRMEIPNAQRKLKPQMLATLLIRKQGLQQLVLPDSAVVRDDNQDHVFVETKPGHFELRQVRLGDNEGNVRQILDGLKLGDRIVVEGGFHLNNERLRKELE